MTDQQAKAALQDKYFGQGAPIGDRLADRFIGRFDKSRAIEHALRQARDIAGQRLAGEIGQEIERRSRLARARVDDDSKLADAALIILLGKAGRFRLDGAPDLFIDQRLHLPGDDAQHQPGPDRAEHEKGERQLESGRAEELTERCHGSYIPRLESCAARACRNHGRSWRAGARHARR